MDGELLGYAREVLFYELPLVVIKSFEKNFDGVDFIEVSEIINELIQDKNIFNHTSASELAKQTENTEKE